MNLKNALLIMSLLPLMTGNAVSAAELAETQVVRLDAESDVTFRQSGEVVLTLEEIFVHRGQPLRISLSFASEEDWIKAQDYGIESIDLRDLDKTLFIGHDGRVVRTKQGGQSILAQGHTSQGTLCSNIVARGSKQLAEDLWVGVSVHSGHSQAPVVRAKKLNPEGTIEFDIFGDCEFFSCAGDTCVNKITAPPFYDPAYLLGECVAEGGWGDPCFCDPRQE